MLTIEFARIQLVDKCVVATQTTPKSVAFEESLYPQFANPIIASVDLSCHVNLALRQSNFQDMVV